MPMATHKRFIYALTTALLLMIAGFSASQLFASTTADLPLSAALTDASEAEWAEWYAGPAGLPLHDTRLMESSIPYHVRERYRAPRIQAARSNSWIVWASAWSAPGGRGNGRAYIKSLELFVLDEQGHEFPVSAQQWQRGEDVWGGCFRYSTNDWFSDKINGQEFFRAGTFIDESGARHQGARIDTSAVESIPAVCHIWQSRWPRDVLPAGTYRVRVKAQFVAFGEALVNVGLDRYRTDKEDDEPEQEILVSDTYSAEHGLVEVSMETAPISWNP